MSISRDKPRTPAEDDCCGGGACNPCVWDTYYAQLQQWRIEQAKIREEQNNRNKRNNQ